VKDSGFTIIELLVVVAIISILATLVLSNFSLLKSIALNATAASDARGLAPGVDMVTTQDAGLPPSMAPFPETGGPVLDTGGQPAIQGEGRLRAPSGRSSSPPRISTSLRRSKRGRLFHGHQRRHEYRARRLYLIDLRPCGSSSS
jgi:prepilin-type N-terminal cleavage/methylation domain-containing protein